jgi:uncharacterized glyoxalase superfamily protein PhnB
MPLFNRSLPPGAVIPTLIYDDVPAAVNWLCTTFGFKARLRAGDSHAQVLVGQGSIMLGASRTGAGFAETEDDTEYRPSRSGVVSLCVMVPVEDVEAHYAHSVAAGARILQPPTEYPFGEKQYTVEDIGGYRWTFSQSVADVDPAEWGAVVEEG